MIEASPVCLVRIMDRSAAAAENGNLVFLMALLSKFGIPKILITGLQQIRSLARQ
ncbi:MULTISPECIES: hypothetical protein [Paenibacillus]|jgi:hypothetical protein|uniref:hypothetical protein n=1 Tax=Paenibacillus TaxID=44249 RepID=UPI0015C3113D|nr:hypothetical protein [Paenibacillus sp. FSL H8-0259]